MWNLSSIGGVILNREDMVKEVMHMDRNDAIKVLSEPKVTIEGQLKQVAMLFKAMAMGIEALKKQADPDCGWISVKDRLPDKAGSYLVAGRTGGATVTRWYEPNEICPEGHFGGNSAGHIRYWMPRPEVPKNDK